MKNKKGFTLVEIIAVILVLGLIIILVLPNITKSSSSTKQKSYETKLQLIEDAAIMYGQDFYGRILSEETHTNNDASSYICDSKAVDDINEDIIICIIKIKQLVPDYLTSETGETGRAIIDPRDNTKVLDEEIIKIVINKSNKNVSSKVLVSEELENGGETESPENDLEDTPDNNEHTENPVVTPEIANTDSYKTLAALKLQSELKTAPTNYNMFNFTYDGYYRSIVDLHVYKDNSIPTTQGVYSMEDDFGTSYYFRGPKALNNIVKFGTYDTDMYYYLTKNSLGHTTYSTGSLADCNNESTSKSTYCNNTYKYANSGDSMYWRIIRINGDGTLRLLYIGTSVNASGITSAAGKSYFHSKQEEYKYSGYTFDNSSTTTTDGTPSDIKNYVEKWYSKNLTSEDGYIATGQFFADSSGYGLNEQWSQDKYDRYTFYTINRMEKNGYGTTTDVKPTLKTYGTNQTFGGIYYLKAGLINIDEIVISGHDGVHGVSTYNSGKSYPYTTNTNMNYWTMSPDFFNLYAYTFTMRNDNYAGNWYLVYDNGVQPVINLTKSTAHSLIGSGSASDPYRLN